MSVYNWIAHPIRSVQEHFRNAADEAAIRKCLRSQSDNGYYISVDKEWVKVRYGGWGDADKKEDFYKIHVSRLDPAQAKVFIGYCDPGHFKMAGATPYRSLGKDHEERVIEGQVTEEPYRSKIELIKSCMRKTFN
jgi:hypothetical protein